MRDPIRAYVAELGPKDGAATRFPPRRRKLLARPAKPARALLDEFLECSSIHGLAHLDRKERHWSESLLWGAVLLAAVMGTVYIGREAWRRYSHFPTVVSIEKDYKNWNTTFAMASLCPDVKIDDAKLRDAAKRYNASDAEGFVRFFRVLAGASYETFGDVPPYAEVSPDDFLRVIVEAKYDFFFKTSNSQDIQQELPVMVTENNLCHGFNTEIGSYFSAGSLNVKLPVKRRNRNLINGSPLDGEVFIQVMNMSSGYNVTLTGPFDLPDISVRRYVSEHRNYLILELTALSIVSTVGVRKLSPEQRRCRFFDESVLEISDVYSYNLCRMQCRADLAFKLCGCVPHFYRKHDSKPYCNASGLHCLGKHGRYLSNLRDPSTNGKIRCGCLPLCNDVHYSIELETLLEWPRATNLKFSMVHYPRTRLKREVIFGFADLLVSIGGTAGLLLGCSVLSFIEVFYFLTFRLFFFASRGWKRPRWRWRVPKALPLRGNP